MAGDRYSRLVGGLKIILPLAALGLLSTVFLLSRTQEVRQDLPFADIQPGEDGLRERVLRPTFAGATEDGDLIAFVAETARPIGEGLGSVQADDVRARIDLTSGGTITFRSDTATMAQTRGEAELQGGVVIVSSQGYRVETEKLTAGMDELYAETEGEVHGEGPPGRFVAGRMVLRASEQGGDAQLHFTDGVKLVYLPRSE
ncbi:LPS export ABC transporter periplasmic protein LptC [Pseudooceanicola onchidii]|uniref:LPS export ABC transporter periplasmic protein LptC n=1 Tax=Pseudooceanicola onchidii TaxID=2562279 RepID=UPI0010AA8EC1|nr:LPS export ABC transporter periplasmic protein LptC [Pseudooceanicola onchidii]